MNKARVNQMKKHDYEIMFNDSPEYFIVENSKMIFERNVVRFICFKEDKYDKEVWYPLINIYRITKYETRTI